MATRIIAAVHQFAEHGRGDVRKLHGSRAEWRLRVGDYRARFTYAPERTLVVLRVHQRDRAYRG